jgi:hypothetical protein
MEVYRARKMAAENIQRSHKEQYRKIWDYCETLKEKNVGTTTLLDVERPFVLMWQPLFRGYMFAWQLQGLVLKKGADN